MNKTLDWIESDLAHIRDKNLFRALTEIGTGQSPEITVGGKRYILLASNSYLGLTLDPAVVEAARLALGKYGTGSGGSRLVSGSTDLHRELEERIASFKSTESAIIFSSGYLANIGTISSLVGEGDIVYSDELNHASIIDGSRLSRADVRIYNHLDYGHLESLLASDRENKGKRLIVTDTVFSMDGDLASLPALVGLSEGSAACSWSTRLTLQVCSARGAAERRSTSESSTTSL